MMPRKSREVSQEPSVFAVGARCGSWIIDESLGRRTSRNKRHQRTEPWFACHCSRCGAEMEKSRGSLLIAMSRDAKMCNACASYTEEQLETRANKPDPEPTKFCGQCYNIGDNRPLVGLCKCGKVYEREVLHVEQFMSSGYSNLGFIRESKPKQDEYSREKDEPFRVTKTYERAAAEFEAMT